MLGAIRCAARLLLTQREKSHFKIARDCAGGREVFRSNRVVAEAGSITYIEWKGRTDLEVLVWICRSRIIYHPKFFYAVVIRSRESINVFRIFLLRICCT